jgi:hypothetical protein
MAEPVPVKPELGFSFEDYQVSQPTAPLPGDHVDTEFNRSNASIADLIDFVRQVITDDGKLKAALVYEIFGIGEEPDVAANMRGANNLSELTDPSAARSNLGLGTAATHPETDFATDDHVHTVASLPAIEAALNSKPHVVASIAALRALTTAEYDGDAVLVLGWHAGNVRGAGFFKKTANAPGTDDGGMNINSVSRRWTRLTPENTPNPFQFGVKADGSGFDDTDYLSAYFDYMGASGGECRLPAGDYDLTDKITVNIFADMSLRGEGETATRLCWRATSADAGLKLVPELDVSCPNVSNIGFFTGTNAVHDLLHIDNYNNISATNKGTRTYGVRNVDRKVNIVEHCTFGGLTSVLVDGHRDAVILNACPRAFVENCNFMGRKANGADYSLSRRAISIISRDYDSRNITSWTVNAVTGLITVGWTGAAHTTFENLTYVYLDGFGGALGDWINSRTFQIDTVDNAAKTFVLRNFDGRGLPALTTYGTFEGSPQMATCGVIGNKGVWNGIDIYATQREGYRIKDNNFIGANIGLLVEEQLGLEMLGYNHFNCVAQCVYVRSVGGIYPSGALLFARDPTLSAAGVTITRGATTVGAFTSIPSWFYEGCWVHFDVNAGMTQLDGNYYKLVDLNRTAKTFRLVDAVTGADIDSSGYPNPWSTGTMYIVCDTLTLESCVDYEVSGWDFNGTGAMRVRGLRLINCQNAGPNMVQNNRMRSGGTYSLVSLEGTTDFVYIGENFFYPGACIVQVWDQTTSTAIYYIDRENFRNGQFTSASTDLDLSGINRVNGPVQITAKYAHAGTAVFSETPNGVPGRRFGLLNSTRPESLQTDGVTANPGAGLAIINHGGGFHMPDVMPRFIMPGDRIEFVYDEGADLWRPTNSPKWNANFDFFTDFITRNAAEDTAAGGSCSLSSYQAGHATRQPHGIVQLNCSGPGDTAQVGEWLSARRFGRGARLFVARIALEDAWTAPNDYVTQVGFFDNLASGANAIANGAYWEFDGSNDPDFWRTCTSNGGTRTRTASARSPQTGGPYVTLGVFVNSNGTRADFFYSTTGKVWNLSNSISTNLPADATQVGFGVRHRKIAGASAAKVHVDYIGYRHQVTRGTAD